MQRGLEPTFHLVVKYGLWVPVLTFARVRFSRTDRMNDQKIWHLCVLGVATFCMGVLVRSYMALFFRRTPAKKS